MKTFGTNVIDYKTEHISLLDIKHGLNNTKSTGLRMVEDNHYLNNSTLGPIEMALYVKKVARGYPLQKIIAFQGYEGVLRIFPTKELKSMFEYMNENFAIDGVSFSELTDSGRVESFQFEFCIIKYPEIKNFDFSVYNS